MLPGNRCIIFLCPKDINNKRQNHECISIDDGYHFPDTSLEQSVFKENGIDFELSPSHDAATLSELGKEADALLVIYAQIGADVIENLNRCKVIVKAGIGYNNIDMEAASRKGIIVANVPDYCQDEVADHTFGIFLALARKICHLNNQVKNGTWNANDGKNAPRLRGKTFGLLGCGAIGQQVAKRAMAFGLNVVGHDPYSSAETLSQQNIRKIDDLNEFLGRSIFITSPSPEREDHSYN